MPLSPGPARTGDLSGVHLAKLIGVGAVYLRSHVCRCIRWRSCNWSMSPDRCPGNPSATPDRFEPMLENMLVTIW